MTDIELAILVRGFEDEMLKLAGERASSLALEKNAGFMDSLRGFSVRLLPCLLEP